jgi:cytochrome b
MPTVETLKGLDKDQLKKVSKQLAKALVVNIVIGVTATIAVTLISGAILNKISPLDSAE